VAIARALASQPAGAAVRRAHLGARPETTRALLETLRDINQPSWA
jgi:ABC-type methionine transport system ATPase subunit